MDNNFKTRLSRANTSERACLMPSCRLSFKPRRKDQKFCRNICKKAYYDLVYKTGVEVVTRKGMGYGMHARKMTSPQLQRLHAYLSDGKYHTTAEIHKATKIEAVGTAISELRRCGYNIPPALLIKRTATNAKVYAYNLVKGERK